MPVRMTNDGSWPSGSGPIAELVRIIEVGAEVGLSMPAGRHTDTARALCRAVVAVRSGRASAGSAA